MTASWDGPVTAPRSDKRNRPIVVAVRDTATGGPAVLWAARRAESLGVPLTLVHAVPDPALMPPGSPYGDVVVGGREVLRAEANRISADFPALHVGTYLHCGDVVEALLGLAAESPLLILGSDRMDAVSGEFRGSVSLQVALGSRVPVASYLPITGGCPTPSGPSTRPSKGPRTRPPGEWSSASTDPRWPASPCSGQPMRLTRWVPP
ncbi:universal stress protein [Arthrobacter sedimenti]|uniref:universal stress protein n=1 Tax=Arthrobacter sedimenti TaxID=2694931 RepID=UPI0014214745|nr:universal stress protein [Arthrobacter sedimenti]